MGLSKMLRFLVISAAAANLYANPIEKTAVPVGGSTSFVCNNDAMAMWTKKKEMDGDYVNIAAGTFALKNAVDVTRYSFTQKGTDFIMEINDLKLADAGKFVCNNEFEYHLTVIDTPQCLPSINTLKEDQTYDFSCKSSLSQFEKSDDVKAEWNLDDTSLYGESKMAADSFASSVAYTAKHLDHGKKLSCSISHPHWDTKYPNPSCSFEKFNVQFEPKIDCPTEKLFFAADAPNFLIKCSVAGNPLPNVADIKWIFEKKEEARLKFPSFTRKENTIEATLKLTKHHLSVKKSNVKVTLEIPNKLATAASASSSSSSSSSHVRKVITARYVHGPQIMCNKNIVVAKPQKARALKIQCEVYVNPIPPNSNISWYVDDDFIQRQRSELSTPIANGIKVGMELDADQYGKDSLKVTLKISGLINAMGEIIQVSIPHMLNDEERRGGGGGGGRGRGGEDNAFLGGNTGLLLLGGGTFFLMILTVIVAIVFYRKGFFSSNESQYGTRAVIAQGTMADSDFFGIADKGYDTGTFQFYQPKNTLDPHGTMTMKLMKRIKESERDSEWTEGFAKMANALYLKDTDQDGYLTVMEAKPVVLSYSDIYHLGITENKLDEVFSQCSNGQHVDVETLLRMISIPTSV